MSLLGASGVRREPHDSAHVLGLVDGVDGVFLDSKKEGLFVIRARVVIYSKRLLLIRWERNAR